MKLLFDVSTNLCVDGNECDDLDEVDDGGGGEVEGEEGEDDGEEDDDDDEEEEEDDDDDDEPPPPMTASSGSEAEASPKARNAVAKGPGATKKPGATAARAVAEGAGSRDGNGAKKAVKIPATASEKMKAPAGTGEEAESQLWTSFIKSRKGSDKDMLGVVPLKMWESFEKEGCIPRAMKLWYTNKVGGLWCFCLWFLLFILSFFCFFFFVLFFFALCFFVFSPRFLFFCLLFDILIFRAGRDGKGIGWFVTFW